MELHRITDDLKADVSSSIDNIVDHVIRARPEWPSPNYEETSILYDQLVDEVQLLLEELNETFKEIFDNFNDAMHRVWQAITSGDEREREAAQYRFVSILTHYTGHWDREFENATRIVKAFETHLIEYQSVVSHE